MLPRKMTTPRAAPAMTLARRVRYSFSRKARSGSSAAPASPCRRPCSPLISMTFAELAPVRLVSARYSTVALVRRQVHGGLGSLPETARRAFSIRATQDAQDIPSMAELDRSMSRPRTRASSIRATRSRGVTRPGSKTTVARDRRNSPRRSSTPSSLPRTGSIFAAQEAQLHPGHGKVDPGGAPTCLRRRASGGRSRAQWERDSSRRQDTFGVGVEFRLTADGAEMRFFAIETRNAAAEASSTSIPQTGS